MSTTLEFKYRIIYESLSRFSSVLSRSTTLDEVRHCLLAQVKYLFDYQFVRFCFYQQESYLVYSLIPNNCVLECGDTTLLENHERLLRGKDVPSVIDDLTLIAGGLGKLPFRLSELPTQIWGWNITFTADSGIVVSVASGNGRQFQPADVPVLRITLENLYAKLLSIRLIDELGESKKEIEQALLSLQEKSNIISRLVTTQEEIIRDRTRELKIKNTKLLHLSRQHAHIIREPLSRILSLAYLVELLPPEEFINDIIPVLAATSNDLDAALQQVIQTIDAEIDSPN